MTSCRTVKPALFVTGLELKCRPTPALGFVVLWGLITSTLLTLVVIPAFYVLCPIRALAASCQCRLSVWCLELM